MRCNNKEKLCSFFFPPPFFFSISHRGAAAAYLAKSFVWRMRGSDIACRRDLRRLEFPSSADLLMQGNWPIYQNHEETELRSHRCIKNGSAGPERGLGEGRIGRRKGRMRWRRSKGGRKKWRRNGRMRRGRTKRR